MLNLRRMPKDAGSGVEAGIDETLPCSFSVARLQYIMVKCLIPKKEIFFQLSTRTIVANGLQGLIEQ